VRRTKREFGALLVLWLAAGLHVAVAQDESAENTIYPIEVQADERVATGRAAFLQGNADAKGQRFLLGGLDLDDPIAVSVFTQNPGEQVRVRLVKDHWDAPERDEMTNDEQRVDFTFRTFDEFKIWVTADQPTPYQLVVWVGDKLALPVPSIAIPASTYAEGSAADRARAPDRETPAAPGSSGVSFSYLELGLIAALLLIVIAFGAFLLIRRKPVQGA